jgi:signal transduction histidine kinase
MITDKMGIEQYSNHDIGNCVLHKLSPFSLRGYYDQARSVGGTLELKVRETELEGFGKDVLPDYGGKFEDLPNMPSDDTNSLLIVDIVTLENGEEMVLFLNSIISPVDATVKTLRVQLVYISIILIFLSLVLALFISKRVSKSIITINDSAKKLSKGDFNVSFTGRDYKEISELSDTLNYAAVELGKTEKLQKELIANVSHDLRTPLTMITGYAEVMRDLPGENTPENVQVIIDEANRLSNLVNDLLDISKLQSGINGFDKTAYNLTESIRKVIARYAKLINQEGYKIQFDFEEEVYIEEDEIRLYQVLYNLMNNAVNYTGEDKTIIVRQVVKGGKVRVEVRDTGEGISKKDLPHVWERYYKSDKKHKRAVMGSGLGLSIAKNILELHGADFGVESRIGKGSVFWFEIETRKEDK